MFHSMYNSTVHHMSFFLPYADYWKTSHLKIFVSEAENCCMVFMVDIDDKAGETGPRPFMEKKLWLDSTGLSDPAALG